ncbi:MAG: response regulator transcription factor [Marmoricola sp.]
MRVLLVEDEPRLARHVEDGLRDAGFAVDVALDGATALEKAAATAYDVVVLDRDLPHVHGDEVCRQLRVGPARILMLTASAGIEDRIAGLELGADDYLAKPFDFGELVARLRALTRRSPTGSPVLEREDLVVDLARRSVSRAGVDLSLTRKEFGVLEVLLLAAGATVSAEELIDRVWDEHLDPMSNIVSVTIGRLRKKLGEPSVVHTVVGVGYRA